MRRFAVTLVLALLSAMLFAVPAFAVESGDWRYSVCKDQTLSVDAYLGSETDVAIPAEIDGKSVSLIGVGIFSSSPFVKSVVVPASVTTIGFDAFANSTNLESVTLPPRLKSIGMRAFKNCSALKSIVIPTGVTSVGSNAFEGCISLSAIEVPETVTQITADAIPSQAAVLYGNTSYLSRWASRLSNPTYCILGEDDFEYKKGEYTVEIIKYTGMEANVAIPRAIAGLPVIKIGEGAFKDCASLESVYLIDCWSVGVRAFKNCSSLKSVVLSGGLTSIDVGAFGSCTSLESVKLPSTLSRIEKGAFSGCSSLSSIVLPESLGKMGTSAFENCAKLETIVVPEKVSIIQQGVFAGCTSLKSVTLPNGVTEFQYSAFEGCTSLESFDIPASVKQIAEGVFAGCTSLRSIAIPDGITEIRGHTFKGCTSLEYVIVPDSVQSIWDEALPTTAALRCSKGSAAANWASNNGFNAYCMNDADHEMREVEAKVAPTCTAAGKEAVLACAHCDYKAGGEVIAPLMHDWVTVEDRAATCTEAGLTDGMQCSRCQEWQTAQAPIPAAGHRAVAVAAVPAKVGFPGLSAGKQCSVCKAWLVKQTVIAAKAPAAVKLSSVKKKGKKAFIAKWAKSTSANATGYQIRYSPKSSMKSAKTVKVASWKTVSKLIKKLKSGKKYYVQVRVYKVGKDTAGKTKTYCSKWSAKKSVKVA